MTYPSLEELVSHAFTTLVPNEHLTVVEAAERYIQIRRSGAHFGPYDISLTPYLIEPQEVLTSLDHDGMVFVGPARTGKSQCLLNWVAHTAKTDPTDMMVVHMTQSSGREWSKADLDKMLRDSPEVRKLLMPGRANDNTFDKEFLSGMRLTVTWPTANNLSGKTIRYNWLMDYDRMADDIDGEGSAYDLTKKRATTFKRFGMTVAESSPNPDKEMENPKWSARTPHEAPPIRGIFELYNRGDRRRWHWRCPQCSETFEPSFELFDYPESEDLMEAAEAVTLPCPHCGFPITPDMKQALNGGGRWVREGMIWMPDGSMQAREGVKPTRSNIASFWMKGPAAAFQEWQSLVLEYLRAKQTFDLTGDEAPLKKTVTTDQGSFYLSQSRMSERLPEELKAKAEDWGGSEDAPVVPEGVRFLVATIDVQARAFVVQVQGFTAEGDMVIVDGFKIRKSTRKDSEGDPLTIDPASYAEDWDALVDQVLLLTYPLADGAGKMQMKAVGCDSGGREGVTHQAYAFWRRLRDRGDGFHRRFALLKGDGSKNAPRTQVSWPDSNQRGAKAIARGDVPVIRIQADMVKDQVAAMLGRRVSDEGQGGGMIRYPSWTADWWYAQMTTEMRSAKGWTNPASRRNEAWDLSYYALAMAFRPYADDCPLVTIGLSRIDWKNPPGWAAEWDRNDLVTPIDAAPRFAPVAKPRRSFADLGADLA